MYEFLGSDRCPRLGYLASSMAMFDRFEHEIAAYQWLENQIPLDALPSFLAAFVDSRSLAHAAIAFEGNEVQVMACEAIESLVCLEKMEEFWNRFLRLIIDRNTIFLA